MKRSFIFLALASSLLASGAATADPLKIAARSVSRVAMIEATFGNDVPLEHSVGIVLGMSAPVPRLSQAAKLFVLVPFHAISMSVSDSDMFDNVTTVREYAKFVTVSFDGRPHSYSGAIGPVGPWSRNDLGVVVIDVEDDFMIAESAGLCYDPSGLTQDTAVACLARNWAPVNGRVRFSQGPQSNAVTVSFPDSRPAGSSGSPVFSERGIVGMVSGVGTGSAALISINAIGHMFRDARLPWNLRACTAADAVTPPSVASADRSIVASLGVLAASVGLASVGTGAYFGWRSHTIEGQVAASDRFDAAKDSEGRRDFRLQYVGYGIGSAFVIGSAILFYSAYGGRDDEKVEVAALPAIAPLFTVGAVTGHF